ncbi:MAG TPA: hypothetical protein VMY05_00705 [Acidobacteriota bacterium]|nr:hypothetical protein [Acidobacteriota bacterium]
MVLILLVLGSAIVLAGSNPARADKPKPAHEAAQTSTEIEMMIENLSHHIDLWHDAVLKGNTANVNRFEAEILKIVRSDIEKAQTAVTFYARKAALSPPQMDGDRASVSGPRVGVERDAFRRSKSMLSAKEQLSLSFTRSDAFSNKYRLINDYVDLLRKQLDMPKVELAEQKASPVQHSGQKVAD